MPHESGLALLKRDSTRFEADERKLFDRLRLEPDKAYAEFLERFSPVILRMIDRFVRDRDDAMDVYTGICERFRANDYQSLRRFRSDGEMVPWLSVIVANACRDQFRKQNRRPLPRAILRRLSAREKLIFRYYFYDRIPHEDIAEIVTCKHGLHCSALDVVAAVQHINEILGVARRWALLCSLNRRKGPLSLDTTDIKGFHVSIPSDEDIEEGMRHRESLQALAAAMEQIDEKDRLLIQLWYEQQMTAVQIAEVMQYDNHKHVYTRLRTVTAQLRRLMMP